MINFDDVVKANIKEYPNWPQISNYPYRILIIGGSGSGKTNSFFNLISQQPDIDKISLHAEDPYEAKYQTLINKKESTGLKHFNDSKAFIEYSNNLDNIYKNNEECNSNKNCKILIVFDDIIADMLNNKKLDPVVTELFIRARKLNIYLFLTQLCLAVQKNIGLNSTQYFIMKISKKRELQQIAFNHSSDIDFQDFMNLYRNVLQNHILF